MLFNLQLSIRENMNAEFSAAASLPIFMQFLSNSFTGFILCSQRLFDISAEPSLKGFPMVNRIVCRLSHQFICHNLRVLRHHERLMMDTLKNRPSFFLNLFTAEFFIGGGIAIGCITISLIIILLVRTVIPRFVHCVPVDITVVQQPSLLGSTTETIFPAVLKLKSEIGYIACQHPVYLVFCLQLLPHKLNFFSIALDCCG